jgi:hypothetical protein
MVWTLEMGNHLLGSNTMAAFLTNDNWDSRWLVKKLQLHDMVSYVDELEQWVGKNMETITGDCITP